MKTRFILFAALLAISIFSCKDYSEERGPQDGGQMVSEIKMSFPIDTAVANTANPFDYVGEIHNRGLQEIFNYTVATGDTSAQGKSEVLRRYLKKHFGAEFKAKTYPKLKTIIMEDYRLVHRSLQMSPLSHSIVEKMNKCIDGITSLKEFSEFKLQLFEIETQILNSELIPFEREALLKTASVMRYSSYFWFQFANSNDKVVPMGLLRKIAGVITGIAADGTSALYYAFVSPNIFTMLEQSIEMSEMCGFYTGGFSYW